MKHEEIDRLRRTLRSLPKRALPPELHVRLRVMASRERALRERRITAGGLAAEYLERMRLLADSLMRPFAVPAAGGLLSAVILFAMLAPTFAIHRGDSATDVPTGLTTGASLQSSLSFNMTDEEIIVDVLIDGQGRVADYSIPCGQHWSADPILVRNVENTLLMTRFAPATLFGQPAAGRTRITLRRSSLDVRG